MLLIQRWLNNVSALIKNNYIFIPHIPLFFN